jgi:hypothetical protein
MVWNKEKLVGLLWILITGGDGERERERERAKGVSVQLPFCWCCQWNQSLLSTQDRKSVHVVQGCDETTIQTTRASHPHHLFGISIIFQRLLLYFPGMLQRSLAEGGLRRCLREEKKLLVYSLLRRDTPFAVMRFQCGMVEANSTCGICQVDGSAFSSPRMVEWYQLAQISCPRRSWLGISDKAILSRLQPNFGHKLKSGLKNLDNFFFKNHSPSCDWILIPILIPTYTRVFHSPNDQIFHLIAPFRSFNSRLTSSSLPSPILMPSLHSISTQDLRPLKTSDSHPRRWTRHDVQLWDKTFNLLGLLSIYCDTQFFSTF